ncbi:hypothetical protein [Flavobacterium sp.]|uniref:hypothetical protein n=1 Tax=Flavobacterium sp. TaxID=239 RepID=UPI003753BB91
MKFIKILFLFVFIPSHSQNNTEEEKFISYFIENELPKKIIYIEIIEPNITEYIVEDLKSNKELFRDKNSNNDNLPEKIQLTEDETKQTIKEILIGNENGWMKNKLPKMKYVSYEKLKLNKKRINFFSFSKPIFLRNNSICIFYSGNLDGGTLTIYYKLKETWNYFSSLTEWVR